ncbi:Putative membrane protein [Sphingopyxis fribergensis]|uniref:Putative membrane protein n=1 Tax=Sphingopyxis fribergensis TaxID=1515612 RepID=A0A0A7PM90_9SPHN|nr:hypothetical protein [Sphingopyxis fribergensis]AJA09057.1 Putative membrane protein [Sphingopyxis fribergensis]
MTETRNMKRPMSPRQRRYRFALGFAAILGAILGIWMASDQPAGSHGFDTVLGGGPLSASFAIGASIFWGIGLAISLIIYHRAIDDHEARAWLWAGLAGWYAFIVPAPVWWVLNRAGLAPPIDTMLLFLLSMAANAIVWLWLKYR